MRKITFEVWWASKFLKPEHKYAAEEAWQYLHAIKEQELSELRAQLASAQAEKAESVQRCAEVCERLTWAIDNGGNRYRREATASQCKAAILNLLKPESISKRQS